MKKINLFLIVFSFLIIAATASAHTPEIVYLKQGNVQINNPEISQAFYDELKGSPRIYLIDFPAQGARLPAGQGPASGWNLYLNLLVPDPTNRDGRYSANIFYINGDKEEQIASLDGSNFNWQEFYEPFGRDYYLKGPELDKQVPAGKYRIEVYSPSTDSGQANTGKYVLAVGKKEVYNINSLLNIYWQIPLLKIQFFKTSVLQFFLTPFGVVGVAVVGGIMIFFAIINYLAAFIKEKIRQKIAKTVLLTSAGMQVKDEIIKLLQKPAYDITVAFITTAAKPQESVDYVKRDWDIMRELGFNVQEIDIEGKTESQVEKLLELKDIIFVEGGNTFYLLKAMRACNFERIIKKLLKQGKVYIGASAGSIVAGMTIETAGWKNADKNIVNLKNLKGLNLVPFNVFVHYSPEHAELINQEIQKSKYPLRVLTDSQAILSQGKSLILLGEGPENVFTKKKSAIKIIFKIIGLVLALIITLVLIYMYFNGIVVLPK